MVLCSLASGASPCYKVEVMSTSPTFNSVALVGRHADPRVADSLRSLADHLNSRQRKIIVDTPADFEFSSPVERVAEGEFDRRADLIIAIGGDGTMLHAARIASRSATPLLGVNRGRLGFLADISPNDMRNRLDDVLAGRYETESRTMLTSCIEQDGATAQQAEALNDVVLQKWET